LWQSQAIHAILRTDVFTLPLPTRIAAIIHDNWSAMLVNIKSTVMVSAIGIIFYAGLMIVGAIVMKKYH
ncbi:MAG: ABC transporter permease, partial [Blautia obeum]|nr:ABC transporter permease [Blautia obeum]